MGFERGPPLQKCKGVNRRITEEVHEDLFNSLLSCFIPHGVKVVSGWTPSSQERFLRPYGAAQGEVVRQVRGNRDNFARSDVRRNRTRCMYTINPRSASPLARVTPSVERVSGRIRAM